ncbi:MAG: response regulator [Acidobacteriota bacterium]|nr:response regulator [Acidobacteriota bacterium]
MMDSILLVDDEEDVLEAFQALLGRQGYAVECAGSLAAVEAACAAQHFDLAVVDLTLPGGVKEGLAAIRRLAAQEFRPAIVAWSGMADDDVRREVDAAGADRFLLKPLQFPLLLENIVEALSQRALPGAAGHHEAVPTAAPEDAQPRP